MAIKPFFYTIEDACKRTGYSEAELFTICHQGDISLCYQFHEHAVARGVIQISDDELEKLPYCEGSEDFKNLEGKGCSVKIREVSLQDADPIFLNKKYIERFRQEKYHECFWHGLMKIPSKSIRHDGYVLAEWLAPYGFDEVRIVYRLHDINAEKNNDIVKAIPSQELEKLMLEKLTESVDAIPDTRTDAGGLGSLFQEHWEHIRSAEILIRSFCAELRYEPKEYISSSKDLMLKAIKNLAKELGSHVIREKTTGKPRMSYGKALKVLHGIGESMAKKLIRMSFGLHI
ncbi:MAG: hypothetical protein KIG68_04950 [Oxalobacter sp.]|nr:hypothetical protein [Oxalobacter sp.]